MTTFLNPGWLVAALASVAIGVAAVGNDALPEVPAPAPSKLEETGEWQPAEVVTFIDFDNLEVKIGGKNHKAFLVGLRPLREGNKDRLEAARKDVLSKLKKNTLFVRVVTTSGTVVGLSADTFANHTNDFGHKWDLTECPYCWSGWGAYNFNAYFLHAGVTEPADTFGRNDHYRKQFAEVVKKIDGKNKK